MKRNGRNGKRKMAAVAGVLIFLAAGVAGAVMFFWTDDYGNQRVTDRSEALPPKYRKIINYNRDHYVEPNGVGYDRDEAGNFYFFDHGSPALETARRPAPPPSRPGAGPSGMGREITPAELQEIRKRYQAWGGEPVPEVLTAKVTKVIHPAAFQLENGQPATFIGIEFPPELEGNTQFKQTVINYLRRLMLNRTVNILFGPQRHDSQNRLLTFVFIGTDMFVNADLVMNGYARVKTVPPNTEYQKLFTKLQGFAQQNKLGMWALPEMAGQIPKSPAPASAKP